MATEHRLEALYLQGRISKEDLLHQLRTHNTLIAERVVENARDSLVQVVDYRDVPQPSMANPEKAVAPPPPGGYGKEKNDKIIVSSGDNSEDREQSEQRRQQEEKNQEDARNDAWMAIRFTEIDTEVAHAHAESTKELIEEELDLTRGKTNSLSEDGLDSLHRGEGSTETIRREVNSSLADCSSVKPPRTPVELGESVHNEGLVGPTISTW